MRINKMNKNTLLKMIAVFVLVLTTQTVFGGDDPKYTIANVWEPGSYTLRQDCFISLITSVEKKVTSVTKRRFCSRGMLTFLNCRKVEFKS